MSKYLIAGAAGFIGSNIAQDLLNLGNDVVGIDSFNETLYDREIKKSRIKELIKNVNFKFVHGDILKIDLDKILNGVEYVINEAGLPGQLVSWERVNEYFQSNTLAAHRLFTHSSKNNIKVFIQASTSSVYGDKAIGAESQTLKPASPYGVSKLAAENLIQAHRAKSKMKTVILRYFSVYGPGQRPDMGIYKFINSIKNKSAINVYGDGSQTRDFTYVSDISKATILSINSGEDNEIYNVSGGEIISVNELIELIGEIAKIKIEINKIERPVGDQLNTGADTTKIRKQMLWEPSVNLETGLLNQIKWQGIL